MTSPKMKPTKFAKTALDAYVVYGLTPADISINRRTLIAGLRKVDDGYWVEEVDLFDDGTEIEWRLSDAAREYIQAEMQRRMKGMDSKE